MYYRRLQQQKEILFALKNRFLPWKPDWNLTAHIFLLLKPLVPASSSAWHTQALELWSHQDLKMLKFSCLGIWKALFYPSVAGLSYMEAFRWCSNIRSSSRTYRQALHICIFISFSHWKWLKESKFAYRTYSQYISQKKNLFLLRTFLLLTSLAHPTSRKRNNLKRNNLKLQSGESVICDTDLWICNFTATLQVSVKPSWMSLLHPQQHHLLSQTLTVMSHNGLPTDKCKTPG